MARYQRRTLTRSGLLKNSNALAKYIRAATWKWWHAKIAAEELAEMIRDGLAEEGHDVQVHPNPETGWDVAVVSANEAEDAGSRAEAIAVGLRQRYDLET